MRKLLILMIVLTIVVTVAASACSPMRATVTPTPTPVETQVPRLTATPELSDTPEPTGIVEPATTPEVIETLSPGWKVYKSDEPEFEIMYPERISVLEEEERIVLRHSIPFEHSDPCDLRGGELPLERLTDFEVSIQIVNQSLSETVMATQGADFASSYLRGDELDTVLDFIAKVGIGSLKGYRVTLGVEGCGTYTYYFPLNVKSTLFVRRSFITEFTPIVADYQKYLSLPEIIPPAEEEELFNQILSTFRLLE